MLKKDFELFYTIQPGISERFRKTLKALVVLVIEETSFSAFNLATYVVDDLYSSISYLKIFDKVIYNVRYD